MSEQPQTTEKARVCYWREPHLHEPEGRTADACGWRTLHAFTPDQNTELVTQEVNGHPVTYRAHRYECLACGARLMSIMQFQSRECPGDPAVRVHLRKEGEARGSEDDALTLLAQHEPIETYSGFLGSVIRCPICGETTGRGALDALRRHDLAVLALYGALRNQPVKP